MSWSNDGTRLLAIRGYTGGFEESVAVVVPADGSGFGVEAGTVGIPHQACCSTWAWAPDDSSILGTPVGEAGEALDQVLIDPVDGTASVAPWAANSPPTWQRLGR
jgi:hypothetical protein